MSATDSSSLDFNRAIRCYGIAFLVLLVANLRGSGFEVRGYVRAFQSGDMSPHSKIIIGRRGLSWLGVAIALLGLAFQATGFVLRCMIDDETYVATFIVLDLLFVAFAIWRYRKSKSAVVLASEIEGARVAV